MELEIDGHHKRMYTYIISHLSHEPILVKPWIEQEDVVYQAKTNAWRFKKQFSKINLRNFRKKDIEMVLISILPENLQGCW